MKGLTATILAFLILSQVFSKWMITFGFALDQTFISQNLCENKDKPALKCAGKCQLAKKLAADEQESSSSPSPSKNAFSEALSIEELILTIAPRIKKVQSARHNVDPQLTPFRADIFHPPCL